MSTPAARIGDAHTCPAANPNGTPHVGGPIIGPGCPTVKIGGQPAATVGDACFCTGQPDNIKTGTSSVLIGGKSAARQGDRCAHGGVVSSGCGTVLIGGRMVTNFLRLPCVWENDEEFEEPAKDEKIKIVNRVILDCIALLEKRLELLIQNDPATLNGFKKWFGCLDDISKHVVEERIKRQIVFFNNVTLNNFKRISYEIDYRRLFGQVYPNDKSCTIYLGNPFWYDSLKYARATVLIHEVSHFKHLGDTKDYGYDEECELLAKDWPNKALYNADSYAFFVTGK